MNRNPSISHHQAVVRNLRANPKLAVEYLKSALDDANDPKVLLIALRRITEARASIAR
jgi:DNA-binding phage protein